MTATPPAKSRFDLGTPPEPDHPQFATIGELIDEINAEDEHDGVRADNGAITIKTLAPILRLINDVTGLKIRRRAELHPLPTLKTLKLLYRENDDYGTQIGQLLRAPYHQKGKPTLEFDTTGHHREKQDDPRMINKLIKTLLCRLQTELDPDRVSHIDCLLTTTARLLEHIDREDKEILGPILRNSRNLESALAAIRELTAAVDSYSFTSTASQMSARLDEQLFVYLRALHFHHHVCAYQLASDAARLPFKVASLSDELSNFGQKLSIDDLPRFVSENAETVCGWIQRATRLSMEKATLGTITARAQSLCALHLVHSHKGKVQEGHGAALSLPVLSVADSVAALCTARYESEARAHVKVYWFGQTQQGISPFRSLQQVHNVAELFEAASMPHTFRQHLYRRFVEFREHIIGCGDVHGVMTAYRLARCRKYSEGMRSANFDLMLHDLQQFFAFCLWRGQHAGGLDK